MAGDKDKALEAGCDDYDTKPVDFKRLLEKINGWLAQ
jgi:DNA-binding response OmpR family regulator